MKEQLAHLIALSHRRNVILRVVRRSVGAHIGLDGRFTILDGARGSAAYMEANAGGRLTHDPTGLDDFERRFDLIGSEGVVRVHLTCSHRTDHGGHAVIEWRKSSRSNASGSECVEVAALADGCGIRDSKAPDAGHLTLTTAAFTQLLTRIKQD
ncbi:hypothetical protein GCM10009735_15270 [Actinomadura chokoriensis]